jgi:hypothetical protein
MALMVDGAPSHRVATQSHVCVSARFGRGVWWDWSCCCLSQKVAAAAAAAAAESDDEDGPGDEEAAGAAGGAGPLEYHGVEIKV